MVLLGAAWLVRPGSGLLRVTMEKWSAAHIMVTVLVLAALIGSSSFLMTLCPMWNGEITAKLMEETEARSSEKASATGEEEWMKNAAAAMSSDDPDTDPDRYAVKNKNQYELMADALLKGQIYLEYGDMDRRLLQMPNPYDTNARRALGVRYHWDHAFYKGRYYMYFGVVPVFLLFIPFKLITGASLTTYHATQVFVGMSIIGLFLFFRLLSKRFFPKLSFAVYLFLGAAVSVTSMVHCVAKPAMYMTAFSSAFCMEIWSVYFYVKEPGHFQGFPRRALRRARVRVPPVHCTRKSDRNTVPDRLFAGAQIHLETVSETGGSGLTLHHHRRAAHALQLCPV